MDNPQIDVILETIRKEHRRTQLVFGIGIVILALVLMVIAPLAIRTSIENSSDNGSYGQRAYGTDNQQPAAETGTSSSANTY